EIDARLADGANPRDAKVALAKELAAQIHGAAAGEGEAEAFSAQFSRGEVPEDVPVIVLADPAAPGILDVRDAALRADVSALAQGKIGFGNLPALVARFTGESASAARALM